MLYNQDNKRETQTNNTKEETKMKKADKRKLAKKLSTLHQKLQILLNEVDELVSIENDRNDENTLYETALKISCAVQYMEEAEKEYYII